MSVLRGMVQRLRRGATHHDIPETGLVVVRISRAEYAQNQLMTREAVGKLKAMLDRDGFKGLIFTVPDDWSIETGSEDSLRSLANLALERLAEIDGARESSPCRREPKLLEGSCARLHLDPPCVPPKAEPAP